MQVKNRNLFSLLAFYTACQATVFGMPIAEAEKFDPSVAVKKIDALVLNHLKSKKLEPNPTVTDEQFLRRAFLSIIGRIPTIKEADQFLQSRTTDKRSVLVRQLLANDNAYTAHHFQFWAMESR